MRDFLKNEFNLYILLLVFIICGALGLDVSKDGKKLNFKNQITLPALAR